MTTDKEIWERFKAGEKNALSFVYFQHFNAMFQYGIRFRDDEEFVKDCIHDVFVKLIQAGEKLSPTENIRFYLFRALKNKIYKEIYKDKRDAAQQVHLEFTARFVLEEEPEEEAGPKEQALVRTLKNLSGRQREIIYLRYECGMEYDQICEMMNLKNDSARKLVFRAIKALKDSMEDIRQFPILMILKFS